MHVRRASALALAALAASVALVTVGPPASGAGEPLHFTAVGDIASTTQTDAVLAGTAAAGADLSLALGDLSYAATGQEQAWCDRVTGAVGAGYPFELLSGNHESNGQNGNINDFSACLPNQLPGLVGTYGRQYYVDVPAADPVVRFVMISPGLPFADGTWTYAAGSPRYAWTAAAVDGARTRSIPWVVVGMHKPCLSVGVYACESGADLMNMLVAKDVDLVLSGHEHAYERTRQLGHSAACPTITPGSFSAACVADADDDVVRGAGTVFATVGTGGAPQRDIDVNDPEAGYFAQSAGANRNPTYGFLDVTADADQLSAQFVRASGGTLTDRFTVRRGTPPPPNQPPTAVIAQPACTGPSCTFDGSGSSDPDGSVATYVWTFGDGTGATGPRPSHAYAAGGTYPVTLTVTDDREGTATATQQVTVTAPPTNQPPTAVLGPPECTSLSCTFDGSGSSDPDGSVASYAWTFGDGTGGSGARPTHAYAAAGSYPVVLTVTDDSGGTASATRQVTVTAPPAAPPYATDTWSRTMTGAWGSADTGGAWTVSGTASYSVAGGVGRMTMDSAAAGRLAYLSGVSATDADVNLTTSFDKPATGSGTYVYVLGRRVQGVGDYRAQLRLLPNGTVGYSLRRFSANGALVASFTSETTLPGPSYTSGERLRVRLQVVGTGTTTLRLKVWRSGAPEPPTWLQTGTDNTVALQAAGAVGLGTYLSSSSTNGPVTATFDDFVVGRAAAG